MTEPHNPYAMPTATAPAPAPANPYAQPTPAPAPAPAPVNPYAAPAPVAQPAPYAPPGYGQFAHGTQPVMPTPAPAPAPVAQSAPMGGDPFSDPAPQEARGPRLLDLYGRLVLITPKHTEKVNRKDDDGSTKVVDRLTADLVVLDGGPIAYGGKPEKPPFTPHNKTAQLPHRNRDMWIESIGLISQCRDALEKRKRGEPGMVLGRLRVGEAKPNQSPPWLLEPATDADRALARQYLSTIDVFG